MHPKYGKGNVVKIMWDKDQVICFLANENRYFTKAGAEFMVEAASKDKATTGADFDHSKAPAKEPLIKSEASAVVTKTYNCSFCGRQFGGERGMQVHECQCDKNPNGHKWARGKKEKA